MIKRLAILSGFDARVGARVRDYLNARQTSTAFVSFDGRGTPEYFSRLADRTLAVGADLIDGTSYQVDALLASALGNTDEIEIERQTFFPAFRELRFEPTFARDVGRSFRVAETIIEVLASDQGKEMGRAVRTGGGYELLLPIRNSRSSKLRAELQRLYAGWQTGTTTNLRKEVNRVRGEKALVVRGMKFMGALNSADHPIRRRTDSVLCDLSARFRLGFSVPARFEFDVSCQSGVAGKAFYLCDGAAQRVPSEATHLNMRINDDFKWGKT